MYSYVDIKIWELHPTEPHAIGLVGLNMTPSLGSEEISKSQHSSPD